MFGMGGWGGGGARVRVLGGVIRLVRVCSVCFSQVRQSVDFREALPFVCSLVQLVIRVFDRSHLAYLSSRGSYVRER